jgi:pyruvate/2-oxoglutarate dehydrogenase complex dihydrolipoamide dehydrogenase (E3) component
LALERRPASVDPPMNKRRTVLSNTVQDRTEVSNVRIIGSGAAGLHAAIAAHEAGSDVVVIGKSRRRNAHTVLAAGGINAVLGTVRSCVVLSRLSRTSRGSCSTSGRQGPSERKAVRASGARTV